MPLYTYKCNECGQVFDRACKIEDRDKWHRCPDEECCGIGARQLDAPRVNMNGQEAAK